MARGATGNICCLPRSEESALSSFGHVYTALLESLPFLLHQRRKKESLGSTEMTEAASLGHKLGVLHIGFLGVLMVTSCAFVIS
jgi:hypothetical protein